MINYIKKQTKADKLAYVAHSMGTTIMFRLAAENPSFVEDSISSFIGIGPVIVPAGSKAVVVETVLPIQDYLYDMLHFAHYYVIGQPNKFSSYAINYVCSAVPTVCMDFEKLIASNDIELSAPDRFEAYMGHYPSGGSLNVVFHYLQQMRRDEVTVGFDYGDEAKNIERYGSARVPTISMKGLKHLKVPVSLFVGTHDILSTPEDDRKIKKVLGKSLHQYHEVSADHLSLLIGKDMTYFTHTVMNTLEFQAPPYY